MADQSKYTYYYRLSTKDGIFEEFKAYKSRSWKCAKKTIRLDKGGEYIKREFVEFCEHTEIRGVNGSTSDIHQISFANIDGY